MRLEEANQHISKSTDLTVTEPLIQPILRVLELQTTTSVSVLERAL